MNINAQIESDLEFIIEDSENGAGVELEFFKNEHTYEVTCLTTDIGFFIDPETGIGVTSRNVEVIARMSTLSNLGCDYPEKNMKCNYTDSAGNVWSSSIAKVMPDRKHGIYVITLEAFKKYVSED